MEIPGVLGSPIYVVCGLNELRTATVPSKLTLNVPGGNVPSFRKARESGPDCCGQKVYSYGLVQLPCYRKKTWIESTQAIDPECPCCAGKNIALDHMRMLITLPSI
jgi:hypothetical protein